ncbi:MAG: hypothetical protein HGA46_01750 [Chlorobiaceae bacterium]|jgi:hypothetical protein|nr:hypothetical protein [Chlorobiaceae bacterium]
MIKETAAIAGGAVLFSPLSVPVMLHGVAGLLVGGAGLFIVDSVVKQLTDSIGNSPEHNRKDESGSASQPEKSF